LDCLMRPDLGRVRNDPKIVTAEPLAPMRAIDDPGLDGTGRPGGVWARLKRLWPGAR